MKSGFIVLIMVLVFPLYAFAGEEAEMTPEQQEYMRWAKGIWDSLDRQGGEIKLPNGVATLSIPEEFYYLNPKDAEKVLVEVWENPPGQKSLGMLFPANMTPFSDDAWAVTIQYEEDGYVSDEDADEIDYNELLSQMQGDTNNASKQRVEQGYESIKLIGWASQPYYDKDSHKLYWAKEIKFGERDINTLNYNIRILGRKGVLVLNFIAGMEQKEVIDANLQSVLEIAEFDQGLKYSDFDPELDKVAAYGIGALVAGKLIAKTGFFAVALLSLKKFGLIAFIFLKKFGIILIVGIGAFIKKLFSGKKEETFRSE